MSRRRNTLMSTQEKVARSLAGEKIRLTFTARRPMADVVKKHIMLPPVPDEVSPEVETNVRSWTDHESAHIRFSSEPWTIELLKDKVLRKLAFGFEDIRVDRLNGEMFPGTLDNRRSSFDVIRPQLGAKNVLQAALWSIYEITKGYYDVVPSAQYWAERLGEPMAVPVLAQMMTMVEDQINRIRTAETQPEVIEISREIKDIWHELFKQGQSNQSSDCDEDDKMHDGGMFGDKPEQDEDQQEQEKKPQQSGSSSAGQPEQDEDDPQDMPEDFEEGDGESEDGESDEDESEDSESESGESGDGESDDAEDESDNGDESDEDGESDDADGNEADESEEGSGDGDSEDAEGESDEDEDADDLDGESGEGDESDEDESDNDGSQDGEADSDDEDESDGASSSNGDDEDESQGASSSNSGDEDDSDDDASGEEDGESEDEEDDESKGVNDLDGDEDLQGEQPDETENESEKSDEEVDEEMDDMVDDMDDLSEKERDQLEKDLGGDSDMDDDQLHNRNHNIYDDEAPDDLPDGFIAWTGDDLTEEIADEVTGKLYKYDEDGGIMRENGARFGGYLTVTPEEFRADVKTKIGVMQRRLMLDLQSRKRMWVKDRTRGVVDDTRLDRVGTGDGRVFKRKLRRPALNVAITTLLDLSSSMSGYKMFLCGQIGYIISETLSALNGVAHEALGFTSCRDDEAHNIPRGVYYHRRSRLHQVIIKPFGMTKRPQMLKRFYNVASFQGNGTPMGEPLIWAAKRLADRPEPRKILIAICDGEPWVGSWNDCHGSRFQEHTKSAVKRIAAAGIDIMGVGIQTDTIGEYFRKYVHYTGLDTFLTDFYREFSKLLRGVKVTEEDEVPTT